MASLRDLLRYIIVECLGLGVLGLIGTVNPWIYVSVAVLLAAGLWAYDHKIKPTPTGQPSGPDWPILHLFYHINPHTLDDEDWEAIGKSIQSKLSAGQLQSWGELEIDRNG